MENISADEAAQSSSADPATASSADQATALSSRAVSLLRDKCWNCHGEEKQEGGLRLDTRELILKGGERGAAVTHEKSEQSLLVRSINGGESDLEMPPKNPLSPGEIALIGEWLKAGLPWPAELPAPSTPGSSTTVNSLGAGLGNAWQDERNPVRLRFGGERLNAWSWKSVRRADLPLAGDCDWERTPIDRWLTTAWINAGYRPAPDCAPLALARRAALDLTGLPPGEDLLQSFLSDDRPDAYERFVDRLLASPRHGEHIARMWLDVVRYSDSNGFDWDEFRREAWRYRDYVIRAFNRDLPFDEFVRQQLSGDELQATEPRTIEEQDCMLATGFLRMGPHDNAAPLFNEQDRSRAELMADLTETTASAFLGQTFSCCRCHDHKTDPFLQEDHYRLRAFFAGVEFADDVPIDLAHDQAAVRQHNAPIDMQIAEIDAQLKQIEQSEKERKEQTEKERKEQGEKQDSKDEPSDETKRQLKQLKAQRHELATQRRSFTHGLLMRDKPAPPAPIFVFYQGDHRSPRSRVEPGFPSALMPGPAPLHDKLTSESPRSSTGRRTSLANWIASAENPWTARVIVNRLWQLHFGEGLVATANDFGISGASPSHPELLDWMASELVRADWSLKTITRQMVTSSAYRQMALPGGRLATDPSRASGMISIRGRLRRLTAEQTRDALLACSGLLQHRAAGPPVWPELPSEILQANPAFLDDNATKTKGWYPSAAVEQYARSVFLVQKRTVRIPLLETLDLPENSVSCARRETSIVAPQALALLNGELAAEAARALAERCAAESDGNLALAIRAAFEHVLLRQPSEREAQLAESFLAQHSLSELCRSLLNTNELMFIP